MRWRKSHTIEYRNYSNFDMKQFLLRKIFKSRYEAFRDLVIFSRKLANFVAKSLNLNRICEKRNY